MRINTNTDSQKRDAQRNTFGDFDASKITLLQLAPSGQVPVIHCNAVKENTPKHKDAKRKKHREKNIYKFQNWSKVEVYIF